MKNYGCVMESEKRFLLVHVKAKDYNEAYIEFTRLSYAIGILEHFKIVEVVETTEQGIFPSYAKIIRVREK